jgi:hypothetical protein
LNRGETRREAEDRAAKNLSDYIRCVQVYFASGDSHVQPPRGYNHAWSGSNGTYVLSIDSNLNPNAAGSVVRTELMPVTR